MGIGAVIVGILSLLFLALGLALFWVPFLGPMLSFGAPVLGLVAIVLGGIAMSRAKRDGESSSAGIAGLVMGIVGLLFGIVLALTCGVCGALCTAGMMMPIPDGGPNRWNYQVGFGDAGPMPALPGFPQPGFPQPGFPQPGQPGQPGQFDPSQPMQPGQPGQPVQPGQPGQMPLDPGAAPTLPPPPIAPGPAGTAPP